MKYIIALIICTGFCQKVAAQYPGPIMDSIKKYQILIEKAKSNEEKMRLAMRIQKIITGVSSLDTATISNMPKTKEEALKMRNQQVASIKANQKVIDSSRNRKDKYAQVQKLQQKNDSIKTTFKNVGDRGRLQKNLITIQGLEEGIWAAESLTDTLQCTVSFNYTKTLTENGNSTRAAANGSSAMATLYRQAGNIMVVAVHAIKPLGMDKTGIDQKALLGNASYTASGKGCKASGNYDGNMSFGFQFNPTTNMYSTGISAGVLTHVTCPVEADGKQVKYDDSSGISFTAINDPSTWRDPLGQNSGNGLIANFTKTDKGFAVSYNKSEGSITEIFTANIVLSPDRYEAFIEPADEEQYKLWLPLGPDLTDYPNLKNGGKGNDIQIKISLWDTKEKKLSGENYKATVKLNSSQLPGYCMNFPEADADVDNKPDLRFDKGDSSRYQSWTEKELTTHFVSGPQYISIVSYDYGGYADVSATLKLDNGTVITAHAGNGSSLLLPKRKQESFIADAWKQAEKATDKEDKADDEKSIGDDRFPGDGLSLFEEYRGFLEKRKHFRGDAEKKDVMICDKIATDRSQDGINMFTSAFSPYGNKVSAHNKFKDDEFGKKHDPDADELQAMQERAVRNAIKYDRCINYNYFKDLHLADQHGVVIMQGDTALGFAEAVLKPGLPIGPPKNYYFLVITKDFNPRPEGWSTTYGDVDPNGTIKTGGGKAKIITDEYAVTVAHELLHCFNVKHHGNYGDKGRLKFQYFVKEKVWGMYAQKIADGPWKEYNPAIPVNLRWEDNSDYQIPARDTVLVYKRSLWHVFGPDSNHSGVEDCIMRYDNSNGFSPNGLKTIYLLKSPGYGELTGITLCNSSKGTGVNDKDHKPMSRYGDAERYYGDCIHQFHVSDEYD